MAFTNNFRIERIYFEKLKSNIDILKSYIEAGATGEALELLKNSVDVDGAVLLLYRNLGEAWAELADLIQKTQKDLKDLAEKTEAYHDELNERIDEVNNYLMALIRELDARLQVVEQDLATMNRNKFYDLVENNGSYLIEKDGVTVSFDDIKEDADFPHDVILRYDNGTSVTELEIREFTDSRIDFYSIGLTDSDKTVKEILVSITDTEAVTYSENTLVNPLYTFGTGLSLDSENELSVDFTTVQAKLTEGTGIDIDSNNEISVDTSVIQAKLTEGTGIDIDSNNEISVDTSVVQPKLSEGFGIDIDSNNEIKVDTADVQEKLIAGQNITLTPDTTDPTKTVIDAQGGANYTAGSGIKIVNDEISLAGIFPYNSGSQTFYSHNNLVGHFSLYSSQTNYPMIYYITNTNLSYDTYKDVKWIVARMTSNLFTEAGLNPVGTSIEKTLQDWTDKTDFDITTEIFLSTKNIPLGHNDSISKGIGISMTKKIRYENGTLVTSKYGQVEYYNVNPWEEANVMILPFEYQTNNYFLYAYVYVTVQDSNYDLNKLLTFLNSLSFSQLGYLCYCYVTLVH